VNHEPGRCLALSGGIGGAKLVLGLSQALGPDRLTVIANTGDDFRHLGLYVCPDIDTLIYTVAGLSNSSLGWGREDETWSCMDTCRQLGLDTWFRLGDRDLALHLHRTALLGQGVALSEVTRDLCARFGLPIAIVPMSDDPVTTTLTTDRGVLPFQEYFVRQRCAPVAAAIRYEGIERARPASAFESLLGDPALAAIVICPSNPLLSVQPILSLAGIRERLRNAASPVIVVSPIVAGRALKGPTAKLMRELGLDCDALAIARLYADIADGIVIDTADADQGAAIEALGVRVLATSVVMHSLADKVRLAREALAFARTLAGTRLSSG